MGVPKTLFKFLAGVSTTIAAVAVTTAFRVLYWWRQQCKDQQWMPWDIQKNNYPSNCNRSFFIPFFNLILDAPHNCIWHIKKIFISWHSPFNYGDATVTTVVPTPCPPPPVASSPLGLHLFTLHFSICHTHDVELLWYCWEAKQLQTMPHILPETRMLICCHLIIRSSIYINTGTHNSLISGFPNKQ